LDLVVSLRPVTAVALFPSKDGPCVICGGQVLLGETSPNGTVLPYQYNSTNAPHSYILHLLPTVLDRLNNLHLNKMSSEQEVWTYVEENGSMALSPETTAHLFCIDRQKYIQMFISCKP